MKNSRNYLILFFLILFTAAIISRLAFLQILKHDFYSALAQGQHNIFFKAKGDRGKIFLQNKDEQLYPIAANKEGKFCFVSLEKIKDKEKTIETLSEVLNIDREELSEKFENTKTNFIILKEDLGGEEQEKLEELDILGINVSEQKIREYPYQDFASHLIGFVNKDGVGQYGVEENYNSYLDSQERFFGREKGPGGYLFSSNMQDLHGADLVLTIDYNIQFQAEKLLESAHENLNIEKGQIIVIEPFSGKIIAMANFPRFNPNSYSSEELGIFKNGAIQDLFEPGSVFKAITMSSAINEGKVTPQTTYEDSGMVMIGGWPIYNYDQRIYPGDISMTEVLEKSINTGAVFAEGELGHENFLKYVENFRIFERTEIDLPGESFSSNEEFKKGYEVNFATASFGQGIEMTPLQLARAFCVLANGGKMVKPYIVEKIINDGEIIETKEKVIAENVILPVTSSKITAMLVSVVKNGFAKGAQVPGYYVAGKTGTAQISYAALGEDKKGYSEKTWQTFIGYAPAFNPKFLVLVKLDNPETKTAEYSAVPIFHDLAKYIIDYLEIPPDY